ncbi:hypothetical protein EDEG_01036 [Edhazardia aedis USNM 41457]|uniref:C2H2-type domain-containing protein n=1 Tax=Edhazardia aedis (strain USNM 41457) TaxID=1003232 RepID=J9DAH4_EDHAE|nr:hypothetical protein EDEG_01036 [Edhazardia aedis USNM 41457]|eukprot:EJW04746.1 hypothetical protein EDEG_01036 [Edhazardia aedis USNM 41457]
MANISGIFSEINRFRMPSTFLIQEMECLWDGCNLFIEDDITKHIQKHIEKQSEYMCMWKDCKRYKEKQANKYTLQAHVRKHTNEKPFQCKRCDKKYTRSDALNKHTKHHQRADAEFEENCVVLDSLWFRKRYKMMCAEKVRLDIIRRIYEREILYDILLNDKNRGKNVK